MRKADRRSRERPGRAQAVDRARWRGRASRPAPGASRGGRDCVGGTGHDVHHSRGELHLLSQSAQLAINEAADTREGEMVRRLEEPGHATRCGEGGAIDRRAGLPREPNPSTVRVAESRARLEERREVLRAMDDRLAVGALAALLRPFLVTTDADRHFVRILPAEHGLFGDATLTEETGRHAESKHSHPPGTPHGKHEAKLVATATSGREAFRARHVCRGG